MKRVPWERYPGVRGKARVARIAEAIEASGGRISKAADPTEAPFVFEIQTAAGEPLSLVCYAFTANKYEQRGRPDDEHRFQIKYGGEFDRPHVLYTDPTRSRVTLMFGVHTSLPLIVAADPAMHTPTWFSSSVEFKEDDLLAARRKGWHGWERDRVAHGRRRLLPREDTRTEVLIALRLEHFLTYVMFERIATEMDPGERLLFADRIGNRIARRESPADLVQWLPQVSAPETLIEHPLLQQLGLTTAELLEIIGGRFRLAAAVRGSVAEFHLGRLLRSTPGVTRVDHIDQDGQPDFAIRYRNESLRIECKNVLRRLVASHPRVDFQKTRAAKGDPCSRYYRPEQFEILAACLHPVAEEWNFTFCPTSALPAHRTCPGRLSEHVRVTGGHWTKDLRPLLDRLTS